MYNVEYDVLEELNIGDGTRLRLVQDHTRKSRRIQLWSSLSKQWNVMHRYNADEEWTAWKYIAAKIKARKS